jgi:hypothetical protein
MGAAEEDSLGIHIEKQSRDSVISDCNEPQLHSARNQLGISSVFEYRTLMAGRKIELGLDR